MNDARIMEKSEKQAAFVRWMGPLLDALRAGSDLDTGEGLFSEKNWYTTLRKAKESVLPEIAHNK
jgi:hypothetical protein